MKLALICAMSENRVIGRDNGLPWHLSEDLKYFRRTTMGNCMIMGRNTWESIGRALPGRTSIVITSNAGYQAEGAEVVGSLQQAIERAEAVSKETDSIPRPLSSAGRCCIRRRCLWQIHCISRACMRKSKGILYFTNSTSRIGKKFRVSNISTMNLINMTTVSA